MVNTFPRVNPIRYLAFPQSFPIPADLREARQEMVERAMRNNPAPSLRQMREFLGTILHRPYEELSRYEHGKLKQCCPAGASASTYILCNSTATSTAAPVKQPTGAAIRTMLQIAPQTSPNTPIRVVEWGCSFDGSSAATPGQVELFGCTGAATVSTALAAADIMPFNNTNAPANTAGTGGVPLALGTALSGFATAAVTEGTVANYRLADLQMIPPTGQYIKQMPLGREFEVIGNQGSAQNFMRVRMTFGTTVNAYIYLILES